jgi:hypothetical protein
MTKLMTRLSLLGLLVGMLTMIGSQEASAHLSDLNWECATCQGAFGPYECCDPQYFAHCGYDEDCSQSGSTPGGPT